MATVASAGIRVLGSRCRTSHVQHREEDSEPVKNPRLAGRLSLSATRILYKSRKRVPTSQTSDHHHSYRLPRFTGTSGTMNIEPAIFPTMMTVITPPQEQVGGAKCGTYPVIVSGHLEGVSRGNSGH